MKVQLVSDVHLNYGYSFDVLQPGVDVFVIAGDFACSSKLVKRYFRSFCEKHDVQVVYVVGNHEYYDKRITNAVDAYKNSVKALPNVHILEKETFVWGEVNFLGTTLWSDLSDPLSALAVQNGLDDYIFITDEKGHYITAEHTHREYLASLAWLKTELARLSGQTNVVVTHHAPCWECRDKRFRGEGNRLLTHGFCNRLDKVIYENSISHWFYGHTHNSLKIRVGATSVVSNQVGYSHEKRTSGFNRNLVIDV